MSTKFSQRISLSFFLCAFFVLPVLGNQTYIGQSIALKSHSLVVSSYLYPFKETSKFIDFKILLPNSYFSLAAFSIELDAYLFKNLAILLGLALIAILLLLSLSLYRLIKLKSKAHKLLKNKNKQLRQAKENAEQLMNAKTQSLSTISHELRTPLNAVTGIVELLLDSKPKPEQWEYLNALKFSSEYLMSLVNNILMLSKLEAKKVYIQIAPFNLKKTVDNVINLLHESALTNNTEILLEYDESLPEEIIGDSIKISQILINLIGNATQFTENGQIWIRVLGKNKTTDKVEIQIEVEDTGEGIPKEEQQLIFESFSQGLLPKNRKQGGTGLGLAIVKGLLEVLDSQIHLESEIGKGSKFWFILPCNYVPFSSIKPIIKINNEVDAFLVDKTVLLVEDDLLCQMITRKILERKKINCVTIDNGEDAIELIKNNNNFHLVLMDLSIRGLGGLEATKEIRKFNIEIPIIALTATEIDEISSEFNTAGFNDIISKPFKMEDLFEKIYRALNRKSHALSTVLD